jgi:hypothetical protein
MLLQYDPGPTLVSQSFIQFQETREVEIQGIMMLMSAQEIGMIPGSG